MSPWMKTIVQVLLLGALIALFAGCSDRGDYECTVDNIEGVFTSTYYQVRTPRRMITMYRDTDGRERTFMFPAERVQCMKLLDDD